MKLGEKIKELRKARNISQEKLAEMIGVSRQAVSKWEKEQSLPTTENLLVLVNIFEIPVEQLTNSSKKVIIVSEMKNEFAGVKENSKKTFIAVCVLGILFCITFAMALYGRIAGGFTEKVVLFLVLLSVGFMLSAFILVVAQVMKFVYWDCKKRGIKPLFWVLISITFLGLGYYFLQREHLTKDTRK